MLKTYEINIEIEIKHKLYNLQFTSYKWVVTDELLKEMKEEKKIHTHLQTPSEFSF